MQLANLNEGMSLPELRKLVRQESINLYAQASGDFNPIHIDEGFARQTPLGGTIAHGMLVLAYLSQFMTAAFGQGWLTGGSLNVRFKAPARPGDNITVSGKITKIEQEAGTSTVHCEVLCQNQKGEAVITGETKVKVKG
ncbi:MAG: MaoC family dehydratase [Chloroflexi bacterium]|nr:MaoC family dehydratase [Chloroflexota bacterium]